MQSIALSYNRLLEVKIISQLPHYRSVEVLKVRSMMINEVPGSYVLMSIYLFQLLTQMNVYLA